MAGYVDDEGRFISSLVLYRKMHYNKVTIYQVGPFIKNNILYRFGGPGL